MTQAPIPGQPTPPVPGAHEDDDSIAGEEDPGAALDDLRKPPAAPPAAPPRPGPPPEAPRH